MQLKQKIHTLANTSLALFISLSLIGCATVFNGSKENIFVRTEEAGAKIYVDERYVGRESGTINLTKKDDHVIRVKKPGCKDAIIPVGKSLDASTFLGVPLFPISIFLVDWAMTGAVMNIDPVHYTVNPECPDKFTRQARRQPDSDLSEPAAPRPSAQPQFSGTPAAGDSVYDYSSSYEDYGISNYPTGDYAVEY